MPPLNAIFCAIVLAAAGAIGPSLPTAEPPAPQARPSGPAVRVDAPLARNEWDTYWYDISRDPTVYGIAAALLVAALVVAYFTLGRRTSPK